MPRRQWTGWARLAASVAIFALLLRKAHLGRILSDAARSSTLGYLLVGIATAFVGFVLSAYRWQRVLDALEVPVQLGRLLAHYLAGQFVGNFLPSTIGGDVLRVTRLSGDTGSSTASFASVVLERLSGWLVLPVLALTGLVLSPAMRSLGTATHFAFVVVAGTLAMLVIVIVLAGDARLAGRFVTRDSWTRFIGAVHLGVDRLRRHPSSALGVLAASFAYQITTVLTFALAIRVVGLHVPIIAVLAFAPIVAIVQVISPLLGGLGVREGALYLFLHPLVGASTAQASAVGLLFFGMIVTVSLLGAPAFARVPARS
jgi:hypothetical protein